jgi:uncharacterized protein involved in exopolysaccharide biosynthesis
MPANASSSETTLLRLSAAVVRRAPFIALSAVVCAVAAAGLSLVVRPRYQASAKVALEERTSLPNVGGLAAIASQLGAGSLSGMRSLQFYADVLTGRDLLSQLASDSFPDPSTPGRVRSLIDILRVPGGDSARRLQNAVDRLQLHAVTASTNDRTGMITVTVELPYPALSAQVAARIYQLLERFNFATRRSAATQERQFAEREVERARGELAAAEGSLQAFLEANRAGLDVPRLTFQRDRLQRRIMIANDLYGTLVRELQEAKIAEVRDVPVFTLVQTPRIPLDRVFPRRKQMTLLGLLLGAAAATAWVMFSAAGWSARELDPAGYQELRRALRRVK